MERTQERLVVARRALGTLDKFSQGRHVLEGVGIGSPKGVVRLSRQVGLLTEEDARLALAMADERNLTVHAYNDAVAEAISRHLIAYACLARRRRG